MEPDQKAGLAQGLAVEKDRGLVLPSLLDGDPEQLDPALENNPFLPLYPLGRRRVQRGARRFDSDQKKMGSGGDAPDTESQLDVYFGQDRLVLSDSLGGRWKVDQIDYSLQDQIAVGSFLGVFAEQGVF